GQFGWGSHHTTAADDLVARDLRLHQMIVDPGEGLPARQAQGRARARGAERFHTMGCAIVVHRRHSTRERDRLHPPPPSCPPPPPYSLRMPGTLFRVALLSEVFVGDGARDRLAARLAAARGLGAELAVLPEIPLNPWSPATTVPRDEDAEPPEGPRHRALARA